MRRALVPRLLVLVATLATALGCVNDVVVPAADGSQSGTPGFLELVAADPLRNAFDFDGRKYATIVEDGEIHAGNMQITYGTYAKGKLTVGLREAASFVDLGTDDEVAARLGITPTMSGAAGFFGITVQGRTINDATGASLFDDGAARTQAAMEPAVGHVYVFRLLRAPNDMIVKLLVVEHQPEVSVTMRWSRLR